MVALGLVPLSALAAMRVSRSDTSENERDPNPRAEREIRAPATASA